MTTAGDAFGVAVRLWCLHELMKMVLIPASSVWLALCTLAVSAAAFKPGPTTMALALAMRIADTLSVVPQIWDSYYWCLQIDGGLLLLIITHGTADRNVLAAWWADAARCQLACFYGAAAFWKFNSSFLDHRTSCAPIFVLTLLPTIGFTPTTALVPLLAKVAPALTITGEGAIAVLLSAATSPRLVRCGTVVALVLHLGIALTPHPNNATPFSLACAIRLLLTQPHHVCAALQEATVPTRAGVLVLAVATAAAASCTAVVYARAAEFPPARPPAIDWWVAAYAALMVIGLRAVALAEAAERALGTATVGASTVGAPHALPTAGAAPAKLAPALRRCIVGLAALYALGGPLLGLQDLGSCNVRSCRKLDPTTAPLWGDVLPPLCHAPPSTRGHTARYHTPSEWPIAPSCTPLVAILAHCPPWSASNPEVARLRRNSADVFQPAHARRLQPLADADGSATSMVAARLRRRYGNPHRGHHQCMDQLHLSWRDHHPYGAT